MLHYIADTMAGSLLQFSSFFVQLNYSRMKGPREPECSAVSTATSFLAETLSPLHYRAAQKSLQGSPENPVPSALIVERQKLLVIVFLNTNQLFQEWMKTL